MPWAVAAAGVTAAAGLAGSAMQSGATGKASKAAQDQWKQGREDLLPWQKAGQPALGATSDLLGLGGPDAANAAMQRFQASPGYQYQVDQGLRAVDAGAAAKGFTRSGATLQAEQKLGSDLANQDFSNYYNRLFSLSGQGLTAAQAISGVQGQAAQGSLAQGGAESSIYGNAAKGIGSAANTLFNDKGFQSWAGGGSGAPQMTGYAPAMVPGQVGVGGFVAR